jgi:hypothetical protein
MTEKTIYPLEELKYVRLLMPRLLPSYLIEHVKGRTFTPEQFYVYLEDIDSSDDSCLLYAIYDPENSIVGYIWAEINALDRTLFVNTFSIDKIYWKNGQAMNIALDILKMIIERYKCPQTLWMTTNPKYYQKHGFKVSKNVAMEYVGDKVSDETASTFKRGKDG